MEVEVNRDQIAKTIGKLLEPLRAQPDTLVRFRVDAADRFCITILVEDPNPERLLVALAFVHTSVQDRFAGCSVYIGGSIRPQKRFREWRIGTELLERSKPVSRDTAKRPFRAIFSVKTEPEILF